MKKEYYVYLLLDPTNFYLPFYIGKGKDGRCEKHLIENLQQSDNKRKHYKICQIRNKGFEPKILIWQDNMYESDAYDLEEELIKKFGRKKIDPDGILTNLCMGNRPPGFIYCQDQEAFRKKISLKMTGENNPFYGKTHSDETKRIIGEKSKQKIYTNEYRKKISDAMIGREMTDEHKSNISASLKGKPKSDEHRKKIGDIHRGKVISDEQKEKISQKLKGRKFSAETLDKIRKAAKLREERKRRERSER